MAYDTGIEYPLYLAGLGNMEKVAAPGRAAALGQWLKETLMGTRARSAAGLRKAHTEAAQTSTIPHIKAMHGMQAEKNKRLARTEAAKMWGLRGGVGAAALGGGALAVRALKNRSARIARGKLLRNAAIGGGGLAALGLGAAAMRKQSSLRDYSQYNFAKHANPMAAGQPPVMQPPGASLGVGPMAMSGGTSGQAQFAKKPVVPQMPPVMPANSTPTGFPGSFRKATAAPQQFVAGQ